MSTKFTRIQIAKQTKELTKLFENNPDLKLSHHSLNNMYPCLLDLDVVIDDISEKQTRDAFDLCKTIMWNIYKECEQ